MSLDIDYSTAANHYAEKYGIPANIFAGVITSDSVVAGGMSQWLDNMATRYGLGNSKLGTVLDTLGKGMRESYDKFGNWQDAVGLHKLTGAKPDTTYNPETGEYESGGPIDTAAKNKSIQSAIEKSTSAKLPDWFAGIVGWIKSTGGSIMMVLAGVVLLIVGLWWIVQQSDVTSIALPVAKALTK